MSKKIVVILGHPDIESYNSKLAKAYCRGAQKAGADVERLNLGEIKFDPVLWKGYKEIQELEPDLVDAWNKIEWADHLVFIYPTWWGAMPALLKGFIDRIFLPGKAFNDQKNGWPIQHLKGKTARLIVTMDSPSWLYRWYTKAPGHHLMKTATLGFCGIKTSGITEVSLFKYLSDEKQNRYLDKVNRLGQQLA